MSELPDELLVRVARLEADLRAAQQAQVVTTTNNTTIKYDDSQRTAADAEKHSSTTSPSPPLQPAPAWADVPSTAVGDAVESDKKKFSQLPPVPVLKSLADVYFSNCQNQPYCFFHENHFRRRLIAGDLPHYLLLAFAATAARYSSHDYFRGSELEAVEGLARAAWIIILDQVFATEPSPDNVAAAQATSLLAIIDFTAGRHRLGWVKIGLAVRLVQSLKLNAEPDPSLPPWQQEERRRVFWSVYLLDKFVSCGRSHPPAILDMDCTLALPCSEEAFRMETPTKLPTIALVKDLPSNMAELVRLDDFAILVLMCSALSLTVRETFQQNASKIPPWDCRSNFAQISSILMTFENIHTTGADHLGPYISARFGTYEGFDRQRVGHFIWARAVYHLCGSLLCHPVSLRRYRKSQGASFPTTFARELLDRCREHATQLSNMLETLRSAGCCARGSFLGYVATCAASVHHIFALSPTPHIAARANACLEMCLGFLEHLPARWPNYGMMATSLRALSIDGRSARLLIDSSPAAVEEDIDPVEIEHLWNSIDYGWMTDRARQSETASSLSPPGLDVQIGDWTTFLDGQMGDNDMSSFYVTQAELMRGADT
ncbi:hypothetical protein VB005_07957 [Metarhizium brunneum]